MPALVPTLSAALAEADAEFRAGRLAAARRHYAALVERAQDKSDRATESIARTMLGWCALRARDVDGARQALRDVADRVDPLNHEAYGRYRQVLARLAIEAGTPSTARSELVDFLRWSEQAERPDLTLDAALLIAHQSEAGERVEWLERGIDAALAGGVGDQLGAAYTELGAALDRLDSADEALAAYQQALRWHREIAEADPSAPGIARRIVGAAWAVGAAALRTESYALAQERLEEALAAGEVRDDCADLVGWILADLSRVYEEAGDVVAARHALVRALQVAREQELGALWPERYGALLDQAARLELT